MRENLISMYKAYAQEASETCNYSREFLDKYGMTEADRVNWFHQCIGQRNAIKEVLEMEYPEENWDVELQKILDEINE